MQRWQCLNEKLGLAKPAAPSESAGQKSRLQFDRHRSVSVNSKLGTSAKLPRRRSKSNAGAARYDEILTAMRDELRRTRPQAARPKSAPISEVHCDQPSRKSSNVQLYTGAGAEDPLQRSPSQTTVPVRPLLSSRISSRSRSCQQPKVDSQLKPIPLKSELFSPLKTQQHSSRSPLSSSSMLASPVEAEFAFRTGGLSSVVDENSRRASGSSGASGAVDSGVGPGIRSGKQSMSDRSASVPSSEGDEVLAFSKRPFTKFGLPESEPEPSRITARPSLAERTRISMAFRSRDDVGNGLLPDEPPLPLLLAEYPSSRVEATTAETNSLDERTSLAGRTRQSISLAPLAPSCPKGHSRTRSSIYPVNQFDTPAVDARRSSIGVGSPPRNGRRDVTPRESLFSPDAEYDSVFKPRPKVAMSPVGSPALVAVGAVNALVDGDGVRGSPLVGR